MRNVETHLLEEKMDEAVTHYINSHQNAEVSKKVKKLHENFFRIKLRSYPCKQDVDIIIALR